MSNFWELLRESVILQATMTLSILFVVLYLVMVGRPIPDILSTALSLLLGFYFGNKVSLAKGTTTIIAERRKDE